MLFIFMRPYDGRVVTVTQTRDRGRAMVVATTRIAGVENAHITE